MGDDIIVSGSELGLKPLGEVGDLKARVLPFQELCNKWEL